MAGDDDLQTHEDVSEWKERKQAVRGERQSSHHVRLQMAWDWLLYCLVSLVLGASFLGLIGLVEWSGPITPVTVFMSIASGWIGTRLQPS